MFGILQLTSNFQQLTDTKKIKKNNTLIHKIHFVLGKHTFSQYRQPKQPTNIADIKKIDTRNREVNCLYGGSRPYVVDLGVV